MRWAQDSWFGLDKLEHGVWAYAGTLTMLLLGFVPLFVLAVVAAAAVAVEIIQAVRRASGETAYADLPSYRDLAWGGIGIALGFLLWLVVR